MRRTWFAPLCIAIMFLVGLIVYPWLPTEVPSHWDFSGQVDGTQSRLQAVLMLPLITAGVWAIRQVAPKIDPLRASYSAFNDTYKLFVNIIVLFLALTHLAVLANAIGLPLSIPRVILAGVGLLFILLGNELGRVQQNWFFGIRTPWTLADSTIWQRTHRMGGRMFVLLGMLTLSTTLLLPLTWAAQLMLGSILAYTVFVYGYSYLLWRRRTT